MRIISVLLIVISVLLKFQIIQTSFISNYMTRYILAFSIGFFIFTFLMPNVDVLFKNKKKINDNFIKTIVPEIEDENIDFYVADMIFKPNLFVIRKKKFTIFIDSTIVDNLSKDELRFFIFHEYSHIKDNDLLKIQLSTLISFTLSPLIIIILSSIIKLPSDFLAVLPYLIIFVALYLGGILLNFKYKRIVELKCDKYASFYVDDDKIINSFQKFIDLGIFDNKKRGLMSSHPSTNERLKSLNIKLKAGNL